MPGGVRGGEGQPPPLLDWDADDRRIKFVKYQATYVDCPTGNHPCLAQPGRSPRAVDHCMKWDLWEKLL